MLRGEYKLITGALVAAGAVGIATGGWKWSGTANFVLSVVGYVGIHVMIDAAVESLRRKRMWQDRYLDLAAEVMLRETESALKPEGIALDPGMRALSLARCRSIVLLQHELLETFGPEFLQEVAAKHAESFRSQGMKPPDANAGSAAAQGDGE